MRGCVRLCSVVFGRRGGGGGPGWRLWVGGGGSGGMGGAVREVFGGIVRVRWGGDSWVEGKGECARMMSMEARGPVCLSLWLWR